MSGQTYDVELQVEDTNISLDVTENVITSTDYEDLTNKPQINEVELEGNKSFEDLGMTEVFAKLTDIPTAVSELNNDSGYVDATGAAAAAPVKSVNNQTGAVTISVPAKVSQLTNDSGFVNSAGAASAAPVQSVNAQTGAVVLSIPTKTSELTNNSNFVSDANYVHTDNNYANADATKLGGIATGAEVNVIDTVKVNGTALTPSSKAVDISVPGTETWTFTLTDGTTVTKAVAVWPST